MRKTAVVLVLGGALVAEPALAQPVDAATRAAARQLGEEGMAAYDKSDCARAAEKLLHAHELVKVPTLAFYAGRCLEKLGRLVDASEAYLAATRDEIDPGAPAAQRKAREEADAARAALLPRIPSLELALAAPAPDVAVTLDGKPFPLAALGVKRPIDPGKHVAEVRRGAAVASRDFEVDEGDAGRIVLAVPGVTPPPSDAPTGSLLVHVRSELPVVTLFAADGERPLCRVPCDKTVGTKAFFVAGDGVVASDPFELRGREATIQVHAGSAARRRGGIALATIGSIVTATGIVLAAVSPFNIATEPFTGVAYNYTNGGMLISGIVLALVGPALIAPGAVLVRQAKTTVKIDTAKGYPVLSF